MPLIPRKFVSTFMALAILFVEVLGAPVANAAVKKVGAVNKPKEVMELITVVVDLDLDKDLGSYAGLRNEYPALKEDTLAERVVRYANDLREDNSFTDVRVIFYDKEKENVRSLANALENLYVNERLSGVVLVGDIPLPVVNKNGNKFVSLFPYTDFENKAFVFSEESGQFESSGDVTFPKPEIWHGVLNLDGNDLASYLDKNHLYYQGEPEFAKFEKKLFFGDLVHEKESMNEDIYQYYLRYLDAIEDLAYMRYTEEWANALTGKINSELPLNLDNPVAVEFKKQLEKGGLNNLPDVQAKQIIDQYLLPYYRIFGYYLSQVNDLTEGTGRYGVTDVDTPVSLISMKDEFTKQYLKNVNDALEKSINKLAEEISEPVEILKTSKLTGYFNKEGKNKDFEVAYKDKFLDLAFRYHYFDEANSKLYVDGIDANILESVKQCSEYLGSSKLIEANRKNNRSTMQPLQTIGINTRILSPEEAVKVTKGKNSYGALIEDNPEYGISAFIDNTLNRDNNYKNVFDGVLKKGDLIVSVNGTQINANNTLEDVVKNVFNKVRLHKDFVSGKSEYKIGSLAIEFYRGANKDKFSTSFMVWSGGTPIKDFYKDDDLVSSSAGAIFELYNTKQSGYNFSGYDNSAGCNLNSTIENSDRCFSKVARMPVLDTAGGIEVSLSEDIDEHYLNSCFDGLLGRSDLEKDENVDSYVLGSKIKGDIDESDVDYYGKYLTKISNFVSKNGKETKSSALAFDPALDPAVYKDAGNIVVHRSGDIEITLKDFSDRYGLFDGIDNDGDGLTDYEWKDLLDEKGKKGEDGVFETRWYDFDEANLNSLDSKNLDEIARKMLSQNNTYVLPATLPGVKFEDDAVLKVEVDPYKEISSVIKHNEPTEHTIASQVRSLGAQDLPIDSPRYVAFLTEGGKHVEYPEPDPVSSEVNVESIVEGIVQDPHSFTGEIVKFAYPNVFDVPNDKQLMVNLDQLAWKLAGAKGSYKLIGKDFIDCSNAKAKDFSLTKCTKIHDKIMDDYLKPVVLNNADEPPSGFELERASTLKIADALEWKNLNIDEKHRYIFTNYLNPQKNAFVGDVSVLPAKAGETVKYGYEAAYLYLDGNSKGFDLSFDKDVKQELDPKFDPFKQAASAPSNTGNASGSSASGSGGSSNADSDNSGSNDSDFEFVNLADFVKETKAFLDYFTSTPNLHEACSFAAASKGEEVDKFVADVKTEKVSANTGGNKIEISFGNNLNEFIADGESTLEVEAHLVGSDGSYDKSEKTVKFELVDLSTPGVVQFAGGVNVVNTKNGIAKVKLNGSKKAGNFKLRVNVANGGYDVKEKFINLLAGEPVAIDMKSSIPSLVANGESKTTLTLTLKDKFGNVADGSYAQIGLFANEKVRFDPSIDVDAGTLGTQIDILEGKAKVDLFAKKEVGEGSVIALLMDYELKEEFAAVGNKWDKIDFSKYVGVSNKFRVVKNADLSLNFGSGEITADGKSKATLNATLLLDGRALKGVENFEFEVLTPGLLTKKSVKGGVAIFESTESAGVAEVLVKVPGFVSKVVKKEISAGEPVQIEMSASSEKINESEVILEARLKDKFGNLVEKDGVLVNFSPTAATIDMVDFVGAKSAVSLKGIASTIVKAGKKSGKVNLVASANGVSDGVLSLDVSKSVDLDEISNFNVRSLYVSLLGGDFGSSEDNVARRLLNQGTVNAVSANTFGDSGKQLLRIDAYGKVEVLADNVSMQTVQPLADFKYVRNIFVDTFTGKKIAETFVVPDDGNSEGKKLNVKVLNPELKQLNYFPGVYIRMLTKEKQFVLQESFSGIASNEPKAVVVVDTDNDLQPEMEPFGISDSLGTGFKGKDKHMLHFTAGNSVGESMAAYSSESSIVYGDPNVRLKPDGIVGLVSELSGFSRDIGKPLFVGEEDVKDIIAFDYNADGRDDMLLLYEDGLVRLLLNEISSRKFRDKGYVLKITNGVLSATRIDVNNDGYDDLIVGTKESCKANEVCVSLFENNEGHFERSTLDILIEGKVFAMEAKDLNANGCEDLVVSDSSGNLRIFYNETDGKSCKGIEKNFGDNSSFNFGYSVNAQVDLKDNIYLNYAEQKDNPQNFVRMVLETVGGKNSAATELHSSILNNPNVPKASLPTLTSAKTFDFVHISETSFYGSKKTALDVNGGSVGVGDIVDFVLTLKSGVPAPTNNMLVSDLTPATMEIVPGSLKCLDCNDFLSFVDTGLSLRSVVIKGVNLPANGTRTIKYSMKVKEVPEVNFELGKEFKTAKGAKIGPVDDYYDIRVRPSVNPDGVLTYLYSSGLNDKGQIVFKTEKITASGKTFQELYEEQAKKNGAPDISKLNGSKEDIAEEITKVQSNQHKDSDFDGCTDSWDTTDNTINDYADAVATGVRNITGALRCKGGGCLPIPFNKAFLVPDSDTPVGTAAVAIGTPNPPYFAFFYPSTAPSSARFYVSPTLTMGLGSAVCTGPNSAAGICYAFAVPPSLVGGCPKFLSSVESTIAKASSVNIAEDVGLSSVVSDGNTAGDSKAVLGSSSSTSGPISTNANVNVRIPGFPSVITNWLDAQTEEIYNKLLDLPDFYFIYPDMKSLTSGDAQNKGPAEINSVHDFLKSINSWPLVQIEGKEVLMKVPAISQGEIQRWQRQADAWVKHHEDQIKRIDELLSCKENQYRESLCDLIKVELGDLVGNVKIAMGKVDAIGRLPGEILKWRQLEAQYATQLICYMDAVTQYTGGYVNKQQRIVQSWMKAAEDAVRTFKNWKVLLDISAEYQESCDECKNDRFSKLGLLLNVFMALPTDLPVIPLPKWPDIIFDISQVKTGVRILWPDLVFRPEPVTLFDLPTITLDNKLPASVNLQGEDLQILVNELAQLPEIPQWILEFPEVSLPEFPPLPALPLPDLPDLPRPPKIPNIDSKVAEVASDLKPAMQVLCLLKKGLVPVPESSLGTEIETLTQPTVQATLPFMKNLGVQMPAIEYDYVRQIRVNAKTNMSIETDFIYDAVKSGADSVNESVEEFVDGVEEYSNFPFQQVLDNAVNKVKNKGVDRSLEDLNKDLQSYIDNMEIEDVPERYNLTAKSTYLNSDDPLLNRSLGEVKSDIALRGEENESEIKRMRDALVAYVDNLNETNRNLKDVYDLKEFGKIIANSDESIRKVASVNYVEEGINEKRVSFLGEGVESVVKENSERRLLAADPIDEVLGQTAPATSPKGFFVVVGNQNENVLSYVDEIDDGMRSVFSDVDNDGDTDIVYSMGGSVYLKENYKVAAAQKKGDLLIEVKKSSVSDFVVEGGDAVVGVNSPYENHEKAELNWIEKDKAKYEIVLRKSLLESLDKPFKRYNSDKPRIDLELENGNYYATVFAVDEQGNKSIASSSVIVAPQLCADNDAPMPAISKTEYRVPLFGTLDIDAGNAFDASGDVEEYYLEFAGKEFWSDLNLAFDENGDGIPWNDRTNPKFKIGPFDKKSYVGKNKAYLHVVDQSGNSSKQELSIEVFIPSITLDESFSKSGVASGAIDSSLSGVPFNLMRNRYVYRVQDGDLKLVPKLDKVKSAKTAAGGEFTITDLKLDDMILVQNSEDKTVAEINPKTGNFKILADGYSAKVVPAVALKAPGYVVIEGVKEMARIYIVADANVDVVIHDGISFNAENADKMSGVNVSKLGKLNWESLGASNNLYPGGAVLKDGNKGMLVVDASGNIIVIDKNISLKKKNNDHLKDPLVMEVMLSGNKVAEVFVKEFKRANVVANKDVPAGLASSPSSAVKEGVKSSALPFVDIKELNSEMRNAAKVLYEKGIIDGIPTANGKSLQVDDPVNRAQFVKILLDMLCVIPRKEAYELPSPFNDMNDVNQWYYPYVKEASLRGLISGYTGEADANGLSPFKAENTITRAESAKIILEALESQDVIDLSGVEVSSPWYAKYVVVAQNLTPNVKPGNIMKNNFILSNDEAFDPAALVSRGEMMIMATRVLDIYNCFEADKDNDGMSDFCEAKYGIDDPAGDPDNDNLKNVSECLYNTDPTDFDTDDGGTGDGAEVVHGTDPLNSNDDLKDSDFGKSSTEYGEAGIYIVPGECNSCPCSATLLNKSDVSPGDIFFGVISNYDESHIFSKSNDVLIGDVK